MICTKFEMEAVCSSCQEALLVSRENIRGDFDAESGHYHTAFICGKCGAMNRLPGDWWTTMEFK